MKNAIRSEWIKLRTARSNLVLLVLSAAVPVAFTILITATVRSSDVDEQDRFDHEERRVDHSCSQVYVRDVGGLEA